MTFVWQLAFTEIIVNSASPIIRMRAAALADEILDLYRKEIQNERG